MNMPADPARYRDNMQAEIDSAALYETLAEVEPQPEIAAVYRRMAENERGHAAFWIEKLKAMGAPVPDVRPSWRAGTLSAIARRFGPGMVLPTVIQAEQRDAGGYTQQPEAVNTELPQDERAHRRLLETIQSTHPSGMEGASLAKLEGRHKAVGGNALRAAVMGANDGLVSNLSLVMGVAGAALTNHQILITGISGLLAGAISMALGEWLSVQSSRELYQRQIQIETAELQASPEEEALELAMIYQVKGIPAEQAAQMAARVISNEAKAVDTLVREELNIDPAELGGSAWEAAFTSFFLFAIGAIIPVVPFLFVSGNTAVWISLAVSAVGMFAIGSAITIFTGRSVLFSGSRQMLFGLAAAAITYAIGWLMGVSVTG